jgi:general secretion pathway protein A
MPGRAETEPALPPAGAVCELRQLDRPAILTLHDGQQVGYALLTRLDDNTATLRVNGKSQQIGVAALAARFDSSLPSGRAARRQVVPWASRARRRLIAARLAQLNGIAQPR